jgi:predicted HicB family RNase H-like nuclease
MSIRMLPGLHQEAKRIAAEREVTLNDVMTELLRKWVEHYGRPA